MIITITLNSFLMIYVQTMQTAVNPVLWKKAERDEKSNAAIRVLGSQRKIHRTIFQTGSVK